MKAIPVKRRVEDDQFEGESCKKFQISDSDETNICQENHTQLSMSRVVANKQVIDLDDEQADSDETDIKVKVDIATNTGNKDNDIVREVVPGGVN